MLDGRPDYEYIRFTISGDATVLEYNQMQQYPITMKGSSLIKQFSKDDSSIDNQMMEAIVDALSANDRVIEIRPAKRSRGMGLRRLLFLGVGAIGLAYWVQNSQKPKELIKNVKEKTSSQTHQAAERIEEGSEAASERIEEGSERAGKAVQEAGEEAADRTEEAGEKASKKAGSGSSSSSRSGSSSGSSGN